MSLIQEALKRKSEEPSPPKIPQRDAEISKEKLVEPKQKNRFIPAVLLLLIITGFTALLIGLALHLIKPKPAPAKALPVVAAAPLTPKPAVSEPVASEPVAKTPVEPPKPDMTEAAEKEQPKEKPDITWPALHLTGIAKGEKTGFAIINGKTLTAGRTLDEVTLLKINDGNIEVEYRDQRRTIYLDE